MMKHSHIYTIVLLACCAAVCSCQKEELDTPHTKLELKLTTKVAEMGSTGTKADLIHNEDEANFKNKTLTLYGWEEGTAFVNGAEATFVGDKWSLNPGARLTKGKNYSFLSYTKLSESGVSISPAATETDNMTLTVTDITAAQEDILLGSGTANDPSDGDVTINYSHPFASVEFAVGNADGVSKVTGISLTGVYSSGKTTYSLDSGDTDEDGIIDYSWVDLGKANATLGANGLDKKEGAILATFVVIPQTLSDKNAVVTVTYKDKSEYEHSMVKLLSEGKWKAGYTTTYTIFKNTGDIEIEIIFTDDKPMPTNNSSTRIYVRATITGAWYDTIGNVVAPWSIDDGIFTGLTGDDRERVDDIFYYKNPIAPEEKASALYMSFTAPTPAPVDGATLKLDVLFQAIPYDASKTCQKAFETLSEN